MKRIKDVLIVCIIMLVVSAVCLCGVSVLTYHFKWQADKALIGITITYILTGTVGGISKKIITKEEKQMGIKMLEGMLIATVYMIALMVMSYLCNDSTFELSSRCLMIWMLLMGSSCIGRIL